MQEFPCTHWRLGGHWHYNCCGRKCHHEETCPQRVLCRQTAEGASTSIPCTCGYQVDLHDGCVAHGHCLHPTSCLAFETCPRHAGLKGIQPCVCGIKDFRPFQYRHRLCADRMKCIHKVECPNFSVRYCDSYVSKYRLLSKGTATAN